MRILRDALRKAGHVGIRHGAALRCKQCSTAPFTGRRHGRLRGRVHFEWTVNATGRGHHGAGRR